MEQGVILEGDCRRVLAQMEAGSVQTVVTSPPYFGLRDYGVEGQIGLEPSPEEFVQALVGVFREVRRVLRDDGTVWLNLGDSYAGSWGAQSRGATSALADRSVSAQQILAHPKRTRTGSIPAAADYKAKDLLGIPWMVAFALRADGWYLRSDIIWSKPNPMPESVTDRPTKSHEYVFLLSKSAKYWYDADAVREPATDTGRINGRDGREEHDGARPPGSSPRTLARLDYTETGRNKRSVWTVATQPFPGAHFATFPAKLIEPCVLAGSPPKCCGECGAPWRRVVEKIYRSPAIYKDAGEETTLTQGRNRNVTRMGDGVDVHTTGWAPTCDHDAPTRPAIVLDPFAGAGTVGVVCGWHGREFVGIELSEEYAEMARERIMVETTPGPRLRPAELINGQLELL